MSVRLRKWTDKGGAVQQAWWVDVKYLHPSGRTERVRKASPINTRRGAEEFERQLRRSILLGSYGKEKGTALEATPTLGAFVERFLVYSENNNKPSTVWTKKQALQQHILPIFKSVRLDSIGLAEIEDFKALMRKKTSQARAQKVSPTKWAVKKRKGLPRDVLSLKSINNVLAILRRLLSLAYDQGVIKHMPKVKLFRTEKSSFDFLDFEEADRLLQAADAAWRTAILVALKTGMRMGEIIGLQWSDLDLVRGRLDVRRTIWRGQANSPKGGRTRTIDLPRSVVDALKAARHLKGPWVFCQADGRLLTPGLLKAPLTRALRVSGISRPAGIIGWHDLRHTYGSHLAMRGVPLKVIQELMGHASIEMTMRYAHLTPDVKNAAVQVLDSAAPQTPEGHIRGT